MSVNIDFAKVADIPLIINLDYEIYPVEGIMDQSVVEERFYQNPYQWLLAKDDKGNLLGYLNIIPMQTQTFEKLLNGEFIEGEELVSKNLLELKNEAVLDLYIASIAAKDHNKEVAFNLLFSLIKYTRFLTKKDIRLNRIAAISFTEEGQELCEKIGFDYITKEEPLMCGFVPNVYLLDLKKKTKSIFINKIKKINKIK